VATTAFAALVVASFAQSRVVSDVAALGGLAIIGLGVRALLAPSRPFDIGRLGVPAIDTSRRLGAFYVLTGVLWIVIALHTART
jgi:uncharacterized membrane protein YqgA involved in biofilm formation